MQLNVRDPKYLTVLNVLLVSLRGTNATSTPVLPFDSAMRLLGVPDASGNPSSERENATSPSKQNSK
jgi:hypothetical protein